MTASSQEGMRIPRSRESFSLLMAENFGLFAGRLNVSMETGRMNFDIPIVLSMSLAHSYREQNPLFVR